MDTIRVLIWVTLCWLTLPATVSAFYSPSTGRWLSRDPINELGNRTLIGERFILLDLNEETNLYGFVRNTPVNLNDVDGRLVGYVIAAIATATYACAKPQYNKAGRDFGESGDKFKHCWVSCRISKTCGATLAQLAGLGKEARDAVKRLMKDMDGGTGDWIDSLDDFLANQPCIGWESYVAPGAAWLGACFVPPEL